MIYYKLDLGQSGIENRPFPRADAETCGEEINSLFREKIRNYNYLDHAPLFDFFSLRSVSFEGSYDWILNDVHSFVGAQSPTIRGWLISDFFKNLLENFRIAEPYRFYPAKVMFQGQKHEAYVFQIAYKLWEHLDFGESDFFYWSRQGMHELVEHGSVKSYGEMYPMAKLKKDTTHTYVEMRVGKAVLNQYYDIILDYNSANGILISEPVKEAILAAKITGVSIEPYTMTEFFFKDRD